METEIENKAPVEIERIEITVEEPLSSYIRNVQIVGGSSFMVNLPKNWAINNGLQNKDRMLIQEQPDGSLLIRPISQVI